MVNIRNGELYIDGEYYGVESVERAYFALIERKNNGEDIDEQYLKDLDDAMDWYHGTGNLDEWETQEGLDE